MAKISTDYRAATLHPRETIYETGTLGALNAVIVIPVLDGVKTSLTRSPHLHRIRLSRLFALPRRALFGG